MDNTILLISQLIVNFISLYVFSRWLVDTFTTTENIANNRKYIIILISSAIIFAAIVANTQLIFTLWSKI